ncbi:MAG: hypothetical protein ACRD12_23820, partial [Acidimicrobiales bacterium]
LYGLDPAADAAKVKARSLIVVPRTPAPYAPERLAAALPGAQVVTATTADASLVITGPPPSDDLSDPNNSLHQHGAAPPIADAKRDANTVGLITTFLSGRP